MNWTLDASSPTLDVGETVATLDGWSPDLLAFVISATITVKTIISATATIKPFMDRTYTWPTT